MTRIVTKNVKKDKRKAENNLEIVTIKSIEEVEAIRPIWEEMQRNQSYPVLNADIDRYLAVIKAMEVQTQPYVILFRHQNEPIAMVIARLEKHKLECKVGYKVILSPLVRCLTVVYGGILGQDGEKVCSTIVEELLSVLRRGEADMIWLNNLRIDMPIYPLIRTKPNFLCRNHFPRIDPHWTMSIPENIDLFYQARSKKHRANLRRCTRKLEKEYPNQVKIVTCCQENELNSAIKAASQISSNTYQCGLGRGFADNSQTRTILTTAARLGWLRMSVLFIGDEPSAFQIGLRYRKRYFLEKIGFDPKWAKFDVGTVLFLSVLEDICADSDIKFIDFGFGDAEYKQYYADKKWPEASVYISALRLYPILLNLIDSAIRGLSLGAVFLVHKLDFTDKIKRRWRDSLQSWRPQEKRQC